MMAAPGTRTRQNLPAAARRSRSGNAAEDRPRAEQNSDLGSVLSAQMVRAQRVGEFTIGTGLQKAIPHGLGSTPGDWFITSPRTFGRVREVSRNRDLLVLEADLGQTFTLWVVP